MLAMLATANQFEFWLFTTLCAGIGAYVGAYLKKSAENRVIHENFKKVLREVEETRAATKKIESQIDDQMWNKQRRWELKRDILIEATKRLTEANDAIYGWDAIMKQMKPRPTQDWNDDVDTAVERWVKAYDEYGTSVSLVGIICDEETVFQFEKMEVFFAGVNEEIHGKQHPSVEGKFGELNALVKETKAIIRDEVRRKTNDGDLSRSQSNESSAIPAPAPPAPAKES
jgi:hypothetical protein